MGIQLKRAYDPPAKGDGFRVLVDRMWPRGLSKDVLKLDLWLKEIGPSATLRKWFAHDPEKWDEFRRRYFQELDAHPEEVRMLRDKMRAGPVTILFGSKEPRFNNAEALKEYMECC
jgi:uncharacterized protein YeaO (DUF488 family)